MRPRLRRPPPPRLLLLVIAACLALAGHAAAAAEAVQLATDPTLGVQDGAPTLVADAQARLQTELEAYYHARTLMTPAELKLDSPLRLVATAERLQEFLPARAVERAQHLVRTKSARSLDASASGAHMLVQVRAEPGRGARMLHDLGSAQPAVQVWKTVPEKGFALVEGSLDALLALASLDSVAFVGLPEPVQLNGVPRQQRANFIQTQLTSALPSSSYNLDGSGITLCLISDSLTGLAAAQASGSAPPVVTTVVCPGAGTAATGADVFHSLPQTGEAIAMLEVMYAIAPNATYKFASGMGGQAVLAQAIATMAGSGCTVIVDDFLYVAEPVHWDGDVAVAVSNAVAAGIVYVVAAGNDYNNASGTPGVWEGSSSFSAYAGHYSMAFGLDANHNAVMYDTVTRDPPVAFTLRWVDIPNGAVVNYDLFIVNPSGTIEAISDSSTSDPLEYVDSTTYNDLNNHVVVISPGSTVPSYRAVFVSTHGGGLYYGTTGAIIGHSAAQGVISVGAAGAANGTTNGTANGVNAVRSYSSDGVRTLFFSAYGVQLASDLNSLNSTGTVVRQVPTFVATDDFNTTTLSQFIGTSASAAQTAAIIGLLLQQAPTLEPAQVAALLSSTALPLGTPSGSWNLLAGFGLINITAALAQISGCAVGSYYDTDALACLVCPLAGFTTAAGSIGSSACQPCPANTYGLATGGGACTACPPGLSSPGGTAGVATCLCTPGASSTCSTGYCDNLPVAYGSLYTGPSAVGSVMSASLDRDCLARTQEDPTTIFVGNLVVDPTSLNSLCCVGRGRTSALGCKYGCGNAFLEPTSYWTSDNPLQGAICFVNCYWF